MLEQVTDYAAKAAARLLEQYRNRPRVVALVRELAEEVQAAEDALWGLVGKTAIDTADGAWLDKLGAIVGEARQGATDAEYRNYLRARILANRSTSVVEDILAVLRAWAGGSLPTTVVIDRFPAGLELQLSAPVASLAELPRLIRLLRSSRAAGVGTMLIYQSVSDADAFTFSSDATLQASSSQGFGDSSNPATGGAFVGAERF